jgi:maleylacetate reductase
MPTEGRVVFGKMDEVVFGRPAAVAVAELTRRMGAERVFLMVSGTLNRETDEIGKIRSVLGNRCAGLFDTMPPHTPRSAVIAAAAMAREAKADMIVTVGGGSITDGAKAVQLCLANDITSAEGMDACRGDAKFRAPTVRQISVPTTLSAGEFSGIAGVTNEVTRVKEMFRHPMVIPAAVVLDPALTVHTPEWLFLSTGIRAVDHCVEGVCSNEANAYGDAQALRGLSLLTQGLARVKADPSDIADAMGNPGEDAGDLLDRFIGGLGMPRSLSAVGIKTEQFDRIAKQAMGTPWVPRNPRPIPTPEVLREILELAA